MAEISVSYLFKHDKDVVYQRFIELIEREIGEKPYQGMRFTKTKTSSAGTITLVFNIKKLETNVIYETEMIYKNAKYLSKYEFISEVEGCGVKYTESIERNSGRLSSLNDSIGLFLAKNKRKKRVIRLLGHIDNVITSNIGADEYSESLKTAKASNKRDRLEMDINYSIDEDNDNE